MSPTTDSTGIRTAGGVLGTKVLYIFTHSKSIGAFRDILSDLKLPDPTDAVPPSSRASSTPNYRDSDSNQIRFLEALLQLILQQTAEYLESITEGIDTAVSYFHLYLKYVQMYVRTNTCVRF